MLSSGYQATGERTGYQSYKKEFTEEKKNHIFTIHHSVLSALKAEKYHIEMVWDYLEI